MHSIKSFIIIFLFVIILFPVVAKADLINPEYRAAVCKPTEKMVTCSTPGFLSDMASNFQIHDCDKYKNANYYLLDKEGHSYGGQAKYCRTDSHPISAASYYVLIFFLTFALEYIVLFIVGFRNRKGLLAIFLANVVSVPLFQLAAANHSVRYFIGLFSIPISVPLLSSSLALIPLEIGVIVIESLIIYFLAKAKGYWKTLLWVALANAVSAILGSWILTKIY